MDKKKNRRSLLIVLLVLLVAVTSIFIGTLARYITSGEVSDDAVVAKFGFNTPATINLFSDSYTNVEADTEGKKVIAPGTEGQYQFNVTGTSEVAYQVSAEVAVEYSDEWAGYAPLQFSLNGNDWADFEAFQTNLSEAIASAVIQPNTPYASEQTIYWQWPFEVSQSGDTSDTAMGSLAASGTAPQVTVTIEVTAVQVD